MTKQSLITQQLTILIEPTTILYIKQMKSQQCKNGVSEFVLPDENDVVIHEQRDTHMIYVMESQADITFYDGIRELLPDKYDNPLLKNYGVVLNDTNETKNMENKYRVIINVNIIGNNNNN